MQVAIDGPAGAGKSTISRAVAAQLGFIYIDTGAMYRAVALYALRRGADTKNDAAAVTALLDEIVITIRHADGEQRIFLGGEDVSEAIRTPEVSVGASDVAVIPAVRLKLVELQRQLATQSDVIMDGRDIGTYVLPHAEVKIFLTADVAERARRRCKELAEKGIPCDLAQVQADMAYRDANDSSRAFAPLKVADDAILIDTTHCTFTESCDLIRAQIQKVTK